MAGTRLLVHSLFLFPFLVLLACSLWVGLCRNGDLACIPLLPQPGRSSLQAADSFLPTLEFRPITLVVADSQVPFWNKILRDLLPAQENVMRAVADKDNHLPAACENPGEPNAWTDTTRTAPGHILVCEHFQARNQARLVVRNETIYFYPTTIKKRMQEFKTLLPASSSASRIDNLHLSLLVDDSRTDWKAWMAAVHTWMQESRLDAWPCWKTVDFSVQVVSVESLVPSSPTDTGTNTTTTIESIEINAQELLGSALPRGPSRNTWHAALYVPSRFPVQVTQKDPAGVHGMLSVVEREPESLAEYNNVAASALNTVSDWAVGRCMGLKQSETVEIDSDGTFPNVYLELWLQRTVRAQWNTLAVSINKQRDLLLGTPRTVALTSAVTAPWHEAVASMQQAVADCRNGDLLAALDRLDQAETSLRILQRDPAVLEPLDFPWDQYGAIFAPLAVPLLLPLLAGVVKEFKRYKKLTTTA